MKKLASIMSGLFLAAALTVTALAGPASAATARPAGYGTGIIFSGCSPLQDGRYKLIWYGGKEYLAECIHLPFGWYWVEVDNACPGATPALAARPAADPAAISCR